MEKKRQERREKQSRGEKRNKVGERRKGHQGEDSQKERKITGGVKVTLR